MEEGGIAQLYCRIKVLFCQAELRSDTAFSMAIKDPHLGPSGVAHGKGDVRCAGAACGRETFGEGVSAGWRAMGSCVGSGYLG